MKKSIVLFFISTLMSITYSCSKETEEIAIDAGVDVDCTNISSTFTINLNPDDCNVDIATALGTASEYTESVNGTTRTISINNVANHNVGTFPNSGNPNTIRAISNTYTMTTIPTLENASTSGAGHEVAILFSGVTVDPFTGEFFQTSSGGFNRDWNITTLTTTYDLGLDCNNAHVQPTGKYHYHGTPSAYINQLGADGSQMIKIGYVADGFPLYYKYGLAEDGLTIIELESGYQLKEGGRPGDGNTAPNGCYDGTYFQDYEYVEGISELDECNGRFGITPEAPEGEYYYVMTDNFPSAPLCFSGSPDSSFRF